MRRFEHARTRLGLASRTLKRFPRLLLPFQSPLSRIADGWVLLAILLLLDIVVLPVVSSKISHVVSYNKSETFDHENSNASITNRQRATAAMYKKCGFKSDVQFRTWFQTLYTNSPVLFPTNDNELIDIVDKARKNDCKVRVRGHGHSEDGLVMQKGDELDMDVIVVNLRDYIPDDPLWHMNLDPTKPSVRMSAGSSQVQMLQFVRPKGYLTATGTIGRLFSLGGVYMNPSTFGGWFNGTRLAASVMAVRVLHSNGSIGVYSGHDEVLPFRGSMGLLGIVTALEIQLREDVGGMLMTRKVLDMGTIFSSYSTSKVNSFLSDVCNDNNDGANFYYYSRIDVLMAQVLKYDSNPSFDPASTQEWYDAAIAVDDSNAPSDIPDDILDIATALTATTPSMGVAIQRGSLLRLQSVQDEQSISPNDGYSSALSVPSFEQVSYFIKCSSMYCISESTKLIDVTRSFLKNNPYKSNSQSQFADIFLFWRIFTVNENEMILEHLPGPGYYLGAEIETIRISDRIDYSYVFKQIEDLWTREFPIGGYHHGKAYGYGPIALDDPNQQLPMDQYEYIPFQNDTIAANMYSTEVKEKFIRYMELYDPSGVFRAGSGLRMLGLTDKKYTVQQYNGDRCYRTSNGNVQNAGCFSNCCSNGGYDDGSDSIGTCRNRRDSDTGFPCSSDCDCSQGWLCRPMDSTESNERICIPELESN